jgi:hypothetical protein
MNFTSLLQPSHATSIHSGVFVGAMPGPSLRQSADCWAFLNRPNLSARMW